MRNVHRLIGLLGSACLLSGPVVAENVRKTDADSVIFQSGFEGTTALEQDRLTGADPKLPKSDWTRDLQALADPAQVTLNYTGGSRDKRYADILPDPQNPGNKVLHFWLGDSWDADGGEHKARVQLDLYGIHGGAREFRQSERVLLSEDFRLLEAYPKPISWLTISEFWNNEWWKKDEKYGFRITLGIGKPSAAKAPLTFFVEAQDQAPPEVKRYAPITLWHQGGKGPVPIGRWFTMDYYVKEGDAKNGRFILWITPDGGTKQKIFDIVGPTHNTRDPTPNGFTGYNPMKLYTSSALLDFMKSKGKPLQIYWDDLKISKYK